MLVKELNSIQEKSNELKNQQRKIEMEIRSQFSDEEIQQSLDDVNIKLNKARQNVVDAKQNLKAVEMWARSRFQILKLKVDHLPKVNKHQSYDVENKILSIRRDDMSDTVTINFLDDDWQKVARRDFEKSGLKKSTVNSLVYSLKLKYAK